MLFWQFTKWQNKPLDVDMILIEKRLVVMQTIFGFAGGVRVCARRTEPNTPASRSQLLPGWSLARSLGWVGGEGKQRNSITAVPWQLGLRCGPALFHAASVMQQQSLACVSPLAADEPSKLCTPSSSAAPRNPRTHSTQPWRKFLLSAPIFTHTYAQVVWKTWAPHSGCQLLLEKRFIPHVGARQTFEQNYSN